MKLWKLIVCMCLLVLMVTACSGDRVQAGKPKKPAVTYYSYQGLRQSFLKPLCQSHLTIVPGSFETHPRAERVRTPVGESVMQAGDKNRYFIDVIGSDDHGYVDRAPAYATMKLKTACQGVVLELPITCSGSSTVLPNQAWVEQNCLDSQMFPAVPADCASLIQNDLAGMSMVTFDAASPLMNLSADGDVLVYSTDPFRSSVPLKRVGYLYVGSPGSATINITTLGGEGRIWRATMSMKSTTLAARIERCANQYWTFVSEP